MSHPNWGELIIIVSPISRTTDSTHITVSPQVSRNFLVSPRVTQLSRLEIQTKHSIFTERHVSQYSWQDITGCYNPITATPTTSGFVVTKSYFLIALTAFGLDAVFVSTFAAHAVKSVVAISNVVSFNTVLIVNKV